MYTRSDFLKILESNIDKYEGAAVYYRAGDPRAFAAMGAVAEMAAMLSQQVELAKMETFAKARDTTVLADAALKGILPKAIPTTCNLLATNNNASDAVSISAGRILLDSVGREYSVVESVTIEASGAAIVSVIQKSTSIISHTFETSEPLASVEIPFPYSDKYIAGIAVFDLNGNEYRYANGYTNIEADEKIYHVSVDEYRRLFVEFGYQDVVGYQPAANESVVIHVTETYGAIEPKVSSPFVFEYSNSALDSRLTMKMVEVSVAGSNPPDITALRQMTNYPSIYDDNAVFMGEFDRIVRRDLSGYEFLSIWNEQVEEETRGANVLNKNTLFVSMTPSTNDMQSDLKEIIYNADDSYRIEMVGSIISNIYITVVGSVARVYKSESVEDKITALLLNNYGKGSLTSQQGLSIPTLQQITDLLKDNIQALQDVNSDFKVIMEVEEPILPEHWHYVTAASLSVTITESNTSLNRWGR